MRSCGDFDLAVATALDHDFLRKARISATPTVNGVALDPSPSVATACNGHCFVSARWLLDLDQANIAHPGVFTSNGTSGLPMTISLQGLLSESEIGSLLLTAKLEKKK